MVHLNLLPWRQQRQTYIKKSFLRNLLLYTAITMLLILLTNIITIQYIKQQRERNHHLATQLILYQEPLHELKQLKEQHKIYIAQLQRLSQLQQQRTRSIEIFNTVIKLLPKNTYLTTLENKQPYLMLNGYAKSSVSIAKLLNNLKKTTWLSKPELIMTRNNQHSAHLYEFKLKIMEN